MSAKCPIHHIQSEKKMNKEQKSFWEYGAAWATTVVIHTFIRSLLKDRGIPLSPDSCTRCKRNPDNKAFNNLPDYWRKGDFD